MQLFKINYMLESGQSMSVVMLSDSREEAMRALYKKQKNILHLDQFGTGDVVHLITDNVIEQIVNSTPKVKNLKAEIQKLKEHLMDSDDEIQRLQDIAFSAPSPVDNNEISMLHDKIIALETEKVELQANGVVEEKFICPECLKSFKSPAGVKTHYKKVHKEK